MVKSYLIRTKGRVDLDLAVVELKELKYSEGPLLWPFFISIGNLTGSFLNRQIQFITSSF